MDTLNNRGVIHLDEAVEDALRTLPAVEPPVGLLPAVMAQIQPRRNVDLPVFRIGWMDIALSLFFAGMIGMAMLLTYELPGEIRAQLSLHLRAFNLMNFDSVLLLAVGASALACISAGVVFASSQININRGTR